MMNGVYHELKVNHNKIVYPEDKVSHNQVVNQTSIENNNIQMYQVTLEIHAHTVDHNEVDNQGYESVPQ